MFKDLRATMNQPLSITSLRFSAQSADQDALIKAWVPEIEAAAADYVPDDRWVAFLTAVLRLGAHSKSLDGFNLVQIVEKAGYSRSTFFRLFVGYTSFLFTGYKLSCLLSTKVYARYLTAQERSLDEFCTFTADVFFGANCTVPNEIVQMLWREHNLPHLEFHPHLSELALVMAPYLAQNPQTQHLKIDFDEFDGVLKSFDLDILTARLEGNPLWGTPFYYNKLRKMLQGYLLACAQQ